MDWGWFYRGSTLALRAQLLLRQLGHKDLHRAHAPQEGRGHGAELEEHRQAAHAKRLELVPWLLQRPPLFFFVFFFF